MRDENKMFLKLKTEAGRYSSFYATQDPKGYRRGLAEAFVDFFSKGDKEDKIRAVYLLLEAIEGRVKKELKKL